GPNTRDELARIAEIWARAEHGESIPTRLVLSGHGYAGGDLVYGATNGELTFASVRALGRALPKAAAAIHHIAISGCGTGSHASAEEFADAFPALRTYLAYGADRESVSTGASPSVVTGSITHLRVWENATRGDPLVLDRGLFKHLYNGNNVIVWSRTNGVD